MYLNLEVFFLLAPNTIEHHRHMNLCKNCFTDVHVHDTSTQRLIMPDKWLTPLNDCTASNGGDLYLSLLENCRNNPMIAGIKSYAHCSFFRQNHHRSPCHHHIHKLHRCTGSCLHTGTGSMYSLYVCLKIYILVDDCELYCLGWKFWQLTKLFIQI